MFQEIQRLDHLISLFKVTFLCTVSKISRGTSSLWGITYSRGFLQCSAAGRNVGIQLSVQEVRPFAMEELSHATKNFSDKNLIGEGKFGEVYKGLLQNGMLVAIKKRHGAPSREFIDEVVTTVLT